MKTIPEIQDGIVDDFMQIGESFDQYAYLVEIACQLPPMKPCQKIERNLVRGCQSHVWLDITVQNGVFSFDADSDTLILKGILSLLRDMLNGQPTSAVAGATIDFLQRTCVMSNFNADRQKGIGYVIAALQARAADCP